MTFEFGLFKLDETGRALRRGAHEIQLQPRAFDLLVHLVRNRGRVVPKDELLDAIWPGVTVTDNSLQRAVSLIRKELREGGLDDAIRNFSGKGYRFCIDSEPVSVDSAAAGGDAAPDDVAAAREAVAEQRWRDAASRYSQIDGGGALGGADLDRWALALQCLGKPSEAIPIHVRAVAAHTQAGERERAANAATALSMLHLERGEAALAKGWLARAEDLVADAEQSPAQGRILWMKGRIAAADGDPQQALVFAEAAYEFGRQKADLYVEALGLVYRGFFRMSLGDTAAGLADQDHAAALALSNKIDPVASSTLYCNILWACRTFGDWARANQWTLGYQTFCSDSGMEFSGSCQLHRAEVLGIRGSLSEALARINDSFPRLTDDAPWAVGDAHRVLGDVLSAIGDDDAAFAAYEKAYALGWCPEPGPAMLLLEKGEAEAACAGLERSLIGQSWWTLQRQGVLLAHLALAAAHAGRQERAVALIDDLAGHSERWPMPSIRAVTNEAAAMLAVARGEPADALRRLHLARQLWTSIDSRFHATRLRLQIADLQVEAADARGAMTELRAARASADELGSRKLRAKCDALQRRLDALGAGDAVRA
jgi:DNA-binding winged helix-turn-helix (wHTH) protein